MASGAKSIGELLGGTSLGPNDNPEVQKIIATAIEDSAEQKAQRFTLVEIPQIENFP